MQAFCFTLVPRLQEKRPPLRATFFNAHKETEAWKGSCATHGVAEEGLEAGQTSRLCVRYSFSWHTWLLGYI